ncbi:MAG: hypothetical protein KGZ68_04435 [Dechloromonas sp.]|nr:hypothetical protein [Dechloromonas sp.]
MTTWNEIDSDPENQSWRYFVLRNELGHELATIECFFEDGPFYLWCMDPNDTKTLRRVGALSTLDGAKKRVDDIFLGSWRWPEPLERFP